MMGNERLKSENENEREGSGCVTHKGEAASRTTPNHTGYVRAVRPLGRCDDRLCDRLWLVVGKEPIEDVKNSVKFSSDGEEKKPGKGDETQLSSPPPPPAAWISPPGPPPPRVIFLGSRTV